MPEKFTLTQDRGEINYKAQGTGAFSIGGRNMSSQEIQYDKEHALTFLEKAEKMLKYSETIVHEHTKYVMVERLLQDIGGIDNLTEEICNQHVDNKYFFEGAAIYSLAMVITRNKAGAGHQKNKSVN